MHATVSCLHFDARRQFLAKENPVTDEELIQRYRKTGDRELYAQLVYRYERELFSYLRRYLGDSELAEDAFQATFLQVHLKCDQFEKGRRFRPWLYAIATNQAIDARRRNKRHQHRSLDQNPADAGTESLDSLASHLECVEPGPDSRAESRERDYRIRQTLESLPESLNILIQMIYYQGLKYREVADALGIPVGTVKSRMHMAISRLSEQLAEINRDSD
jgi:RNA polymerase sigma-70 factor, ECF subfamily